MENYYSLKDEKIIQAKQRAQKLCVEYNEKVNQENFYDEALLNALLKKVGRDPYVEPNFRCFLGSRIELGDEVFLNHDVTLQDMAEITIGNNVNIAPRTGIFTEFCPKDKELRRQKKSLRQTGRDRRRRLARRKRDRLGRSHDRQKQHHRSRFGRHGRHSGKRDRSRQSCQSHQKNRSRLKARDLGVSRAFFGYSKLRFVV